MGHTTRERAWTEIERRIVAGELAGGSRFDEDAVARDIGVEPDAVREALCRLERDGFVRPMPDGAFAVAELNEIELREAYPVAILLEGLAMRTTPSYPEGSFARLREINEALAAATDDAMEASTRDWQFHEELVRYCDNEQLLATLRPLKRMLLRYEYAYLRGERPVSKSVSDHATIIEALERDDRERAAELVEANFRDALPALLQKI
jgi:DNA-binding GntR family transcriptional regulator